MSKKTSLLLASALLLLTLFATAQSSFKTLSADFKSIEGSWRGSLSYLDYSSGKPYTMPAEFHQFQKKKGRAVYRSKQLDQPPRICLYPQTRE